MEELSELFRDLGRCIESLVVVLVMGCLAACSSTPPIPTKWESMSTGSAHTCAISEHKQLWCWGASRNGRLGVELDSKEDRAALSTANHPLPELVNDAVWKAVSAGDAHSCGVRDNGTLWCWGSSASGQLGGGSTSTSVRPTQVGGDANWASVAAGTSHTCAIRANKTLWCWGRDMNGEVGVGTSELRYLSPQQVGQKSNWTNVSAGHIHSCGIQNDETLWCWGLGSGIGAGTEDRLEPWQIGADSDWRAIAAAGQHNCGLRHNGTLWCWGAGELGRLGTGDELSLTEPTQIGDESNWRQISVRGSHSCAVREDQSLWCWGNGMNGRLGLGDIVSRSVPTPVEPGTGWAQVSAGGGHSCAISVDREMQCWGANDVGQLGNGEHGGLKRLPVAMDGQHDFDHISVGSSHACGVDKGGALLCWGSGEDGRTGLGVESPRTSPERVDQETWSQVSAGSKHTCGVRTEGTLWCWGSNTYSQLGLGYRTPGRFTPHQVGEDTDWGYVAAGDIHSCGIRDNGTLWCWGFGSSGQLGRRDSQEHQGNPQQVGSASDWSAVAADKFQTCGIRDNRTLWCWGNDIFAPVQVGDKADWVNVSIGRSHACGIRKNSTLWCWGSSSFGQLGLGSGHFPKPDPVQVGDKADWSRVSAGNTYTCAVRENGTLWCWGSGALGVVEVIDFDTPEFDTPHQVGRDTNWSQVSAGGNTTYGIRTSGAGWAWGDNSHGQLGDGRLWSTQPVRVGGWRRSPGSPSPSP